MMIDIEHPHDQPSEAARAAVEIIAQKLEQRFNAVTHWENHILHFNRSGIEGRIEGRIEVLPGAVRVQAKLGLFVSIMQEAMENRIRQILAEKLP